ncbi:MAG: hypothetical protein SPI77_04225 [Corynebacterium sp.]|nr:hypothetical protein [Corynebacterium sp.]
MAWISRAIFPIHPGVMNWGAYKKVLNSKHVKTPKKEPQAVKALDKKGSFFLHSLQGFSNHASRFIFVLERDPMKNRLVASGVAVSVALAGGVVAAPAASSLNFSEGFNACMAQAKYLTEDLKDNPDFAKVWEQGKALGGNAGSSAPGDAFSLCMEASLSSNIPDAVGPAVGILLAIIVGALGLAGGAAWFLDQQGIVDLPL